MNYSLFLGVLFCLVVSASGCGQKDSVLADSSQKEFQRDEYVLKISKNELEFNSSLNYRFASWILELPPVEQLKKVKKLQIESDDIAKFSFNQVDMYIDPYNKFDSPIPPFIRLSLPTSVLERKESTTLMSFPGERISEVLDMMVKSVESSDSKESPEEKCESIRLRIFLTDTTQPGNPIQVALLTKLWVLKSK